MINVGIVDDHAAIAHGVAMLMRPQTDMQVLASAASVSALANGRHSFDVLLLDLSLGDSSKVSENVAAAQLLTDKVIVFTSGEHPHLIREATRAGVVGVVRKSAPPEKLFQTIRSAHENAGTPDPEWVAALETDRQFVTALLTPREVEVLSLYASGEPAKRVANALFISEQTVVDHVRNIRTKYAEQDRPVKSKVDLFRRAVEDGVITLN